MTRIVKETNAVRPVYLPVYLHHGVLREVSITTKLRVVFDGSATDSENHIRHFINDTLMVGATLQDNVTTL